MRRSILTLLPAFCLFAQQQPPTQRAEMDGVAADLSVRDIDGAPGTAQVTIRVTDAASGTPLDGPAPRVWFSKRRNEAVAIETPCLDKIRSFAGGQLSARADADLDGYLVVTMNQDSTVTFLNPAVASLSQLESIVELKGVGQDMVYAPAVGRIFISVAATASLAVIDIATRKLVADVALPKSSTRLALSPGGTSVWASMEGDAGLAVINVSSLRIEATLAVGLGPHAFAFSSDARQVLVTSAKSDTADLFDAVGHQRIASVHAGATPVAAVFAPAARMFYIANLNGKEVVGLDPESGKLTARVPVAPGVVALAVDPEGRYIAAVNQTQNTLTMIDTATNGIIGTTNAGTEPDQIASTARYAYIRSLDSDQFTLLDWKDLRAGNAQPLRIQAGRHKPVEAPEAVGAAPVLAPAPEGNTMIIANAPDGILYFYEEGMMAPKGTISNYKRKARGILVINQGLHRTGTGVYEGTVRVPSEGRYDVPLLIEEPRFHHCFSTSFASGAAPPRQDFRMLTVEPLFSDRKFTAGQNTLLRFRLKDAAGQPVTGLRQLQLLAFQPPGVWQSHQWLQEAAEGVYEAAQVFPVSANVLLSVN
ncbi:MAG: hypothetical protein QOE06_3700, partial [Thermoleophilaceae bacterium]|nr:hypothetical protein [Thermoleophilaceae bacterium]